jgi:AcrR family transcriptional regulator
VRTEDRRDAILRAAIEMFREVGYERATMSAISERAPVSKPTLYGYFKSKDELFAAAMIAALEEQGEDLALIEQLDLAEPDIGLVLRRFGEAYFTLVTSSDAIAIMRVAIAEGANSKLGSLLYERGAEHAWGQITEYLVELQARGILREQQPRIIAAHLKSLLEGGVLEPLLYGAKPWFDRTEAIEAAVDTFLRAYTVNN